MSLISKVPHPIPYQGSKRNIAKEIIGYFPRNIDTLHEPFAGSAAITLAAAARGLANNYHLNDINKPLIDLWQMIIESPERISKQYSSLWHKQEENPRDFYDKIRSEFNKTARPDHFLYLLARCVKASVRFNTNGEFNQSPDNRRLGMKPETMREMIMGASYLLNWKTKFSSESYMYVLEEANIEDFIYMDPPYQGVCRNKDSRYFTSVKYENFVELLEQLNNNNMRYIVSYDGRTGEKIHGKFLPRSLNLTHIEIHTGRSTQATLLGRNDLTVESLYLSPPLINEIESSLSPNTREKREQLSLFESIA